jgi:hypothetical protein
MKIRFKQWLHPQMGVVPVNPKTPLVLEAETEREWVGLTDDDIWEVYKKHDSMQYMEFSRAIEAKLKEKNHG